MIHIQNRRAKPIYIRMAEFGAIPLTVMLGLIVFTRVVCRSHLLYDVDSVNFALALRRFDPTVHQPHPPGYFLYVVLGRLINAVVHDPNTALVGISIAASAAAAGAIYVLTNAWFGRRAAIISLLLFLFSPLCWFHGTVALTYIVEAFFSALVGYCCWRMQADSRWVVAASVVLGVSAGFRPSSLVFLLPLWMFSIRRISLRWICAGCLTLGVTLAAWCIPAVASAGGPEAYVRPLQHLWGTVPGRTTVLGGHFAMSLVRVLTIAWIYVLCFGAAAPAILWARDPECPGRRERLVFTVFWLAPGVLFFTFGFLLFVNSGYLLVLSPPVFAWLSSVLDRLHARTAAHRPRFVAAAAAGCLANSLWFLYAPIYCSHRSVRSFETRMARIAGAVRQRFNPKDTIIVGFDSHFLGYRHAGYYLPEYRTVQYPEIRYPEGPRVFELQARDTRLAEQLAVDHYSRFVLFPLPAGREYADYLKKVLGRFPPNTFKRECGAGEAFITGTASDLGALFPHTMQ